MHLKCILKTHTKKQVQTEKSSAHTIFFRLLPVLFLLVLWPKMSSLVSSDITPEGLEDSGQTWTIQQTLVTCRTQLICKKLLLIIVVLFSQIIVSCCYQRFKSIAAMLDFHVSNFLTLNSGFSYYFFPILKLEMLR